MSSIEPTSDAKCNVVDSNYSNITGYSRITTNFMSSQTKLFGVGELIKAVEEDRRRETMATDENRVKADISGGWELQSTYRIDEFLERRQQMEIFNLTFRCAQQFFEFPDNQLHMHQKLQGHEFHHKLYQMSEPKISGKRFIISYICGKSLKTIIIHDSNNGDVETVRSFVDGEGRLHIVNERHGVECERVYRKIEEREDVEELRARIRELETRIEELSGSSSTRLS